MRKKPGTKQSHGEKVVKDIRRANHSSDVYASGLSIWNASSGILS